jgi:hypothetical protein
MTQTMGKHEDLPLDDQVSPASAQGGSRQHWLALQPTWEEYRAA